MSKDEDPQTPSKQVPPTSEEQEVKAIAACIAEMVKSGRTSTKPSIEAAVQARLDGMSIAVANLDKLVALAERKGADHDAQEHVFKAIVHLLQALRDSDGKPRIEHDHVVFAKNWALVYDDS